MIVAELIPQFSEKKSFGGKALIRIDSSGIQLYSYDVLVLLGFVNVLGKWSIQKRWNGYSATTLSHVKELVQQIYGENIVFDKEVWDNMDTDLWYMASDLEELKKSIR